MIFVDLTASAFGIAVPEDRTGGTTCCSLTPARRELGGKKKNMLATDKCECSQ